MTATYTAVATDKDKVRLLIGDTVTASALLQDEEIAYFLTQNTDPTGAAVLACRAIAAQLSRLADTSIESVRVSHSQKAQAYLKMAGDLERQARAAAVSSVLPSVTGTSKSAIQTAQDNSDRRTDQFRPGQFRNPEGDGV